MKRSFLTLWCAAVLATAAAFVVHLAIRYETVRLGYQVSETRNQHKVLEQNRRLLSIEAATLRQSARIEGIARDSLDMDVPDPSRIILISEEKP